MKISEQINHYNNLHNKKIEELPIMNLEICGVKIKQIGKSIDPEYKGDLVYHCTYEGEIYPIEVSCNRELLEFCQYIKDDYE
jgi:hypothetical protein|tara:strand:+ start:229 stop:474 length:246 start_codon:yes stop_codon:yes gene_type:complete